MEKNPGDLYTMPTFCGGSFVTGAEQVGQEVISSRLMNSPQLGQRYLYLGIGFLGMFGYAFGVPRSDDIIYFLDGDIWVFVAACCFLGDMEYLLDMFLQDVEVDDEVEGFEPGLAECGFAPQASAVFRLACVIFRVEPSRDVLDYLVLVVFRRNVGGIHSFRAKRWGPAEERVVLSPAGVQRQKPLGFYPG